MGMMIVRHKVSSGLTEIAEAVDASGPTLPKANELQASEGDEPERVLRELELAPDRKLVGRIHNKVAWTLAFLAGNVRCCSGYFLADCYWEPITLSQVLTADIPALGPKAMGRTRHARHGCKAAGKHRPSGHLPSHDTVDANQPIFSSP